MMGVSVGEEIDPALVPVLYDQMGFERPLPRKDIPGRIAPSADFEVLVIGGGMSGIAAGIKLAEAGYNYTIIEKNPELGGTWYENRYPGVGVDTPSHFYSYSFELNPEWSHFHPKGPEIQGYLTGGADKYNVRGNVVFNTRVTGATWDDAVVLKDGTRIETDLIACATGFEIVKVVGDLEIVGRGGRRIQEDWGEDDPRSYLGVMAPGYPNFFFILGPNSAPNHAAGVNMVMEAQINRMLETLDMMVAKQAACVEPTIEGDADWNRKVEDQMRQMIWSHPKAKSYYLNSQGRNVISCPFGLADYWNWTRDPKEKELSFS